MTKAKLAKGRLTPRQETFAQRLAFGDSQAQAYRVAGFNAKGDLIYPAASRLAGQAKVRARVDQLRVDLGRARASTLVVTAQTISEMLMETYRAGLDLKQVGAAATAAMGLAKLHGLLVDKTEDVTRRAARSPDAPVEIEVEHWLTEQGVTIEPERPSPKDLTDQRPAGHGAPLPVEPLDPVEVQGSDPAGLDESGDGSGDDPSVRPLTH